MVPVLQEFYKSFIHMALRMFCGLPRVVPDSARVVEAGTWMNCAGIPCNLLVGFEDSPKPSTLNLQLIPVKLWGT